MRDAKIAILLIGMIAWSTPTTSGQSNERERSALARLANEIDQFEQLITSAEQKASSDARFAFDYAGLRSTLGQARLQINLHLDIERRQPRNLIGKTDG